MSQLKRRKQDNSFEVVGDKSLPIRLLADGTAEDDSYVAIDNGTGARKCTAQQLVDATEVDATKVVDSTLNKTQAEINSSLKTVKLIIPQTSLAAGAGNNVSIDVSSLQLTDIDQVISFSINGAFADAWITYGVSYIGTDVITIGVHNMFNSTLVAEGTLYLMYKE